MKKKRILKVVKVLLFISMLILIYIVSPKITETIQNMARYIAEVDSNYITRVVELILSVSMVLSVSITKKEITTNSKK